MALRHFPDSHSTPATRETLRVSSQSRVVLVACASLDGSLILQKFFTDETFAAQNFIIDYANSRRDEPDISTELLAFNLSFDRHGAVAAIRVYDHTWKICERLVSIGKFAKIRDLWDPISAGDFDSLYLDSIRRDIHISDRPDWAALPPSKTAGMPRPPYGGRHFSAL